MPYQSWPEVVAATQGDGTAVTNTVTRTSVVHPSFNVTLPGAQFTDPRQRADLRAEGRVSTAASTPGTLTLSLMFGTNVVATFTTPTVTVSLTNASWWLEWQFDFRSPGATAAFLHVATFTSAVQAGTVAAPGTGLYPTTAPVIGATFDSRVGQVVDLAATWSVANASNSILAHSARFMVMN
jgi:hypothetical protein